MDDGGVVAGAVRAPTKANYRKELGRLAHFEGPLMLREADHWDRAREKEEELKDRWSKFLKKKAKRAKRAEMVLENAPEGVVAASPARSPGTSRAEQAPPPPCTTDRRHRHAFTCPGDCGASAESSAHTGAGDAVPARTLSHQRGPHGNRMEPLTAPDRGSPNSIRHCSTTQRRCRRFDHVHPACGYRQRTTPPALKRAWWR